MVLLIFLQNSKQLIQCVKSSNKHENESICSAQKRRANTSSNIQEIGAKSIQSKNKILANIHRVFENLNQEKLKLRGIKLNKIHKLIFQNLS